MKILVTPDGEARHGDPQNNLKLGNLSLGLPPGLEQHEDLDVEIELPNTHCNVGGEDPTSGQPACLMCPRNRSDFRPDKDRTIESCQALAPLLPKIRHLRFSGLAEPFWKGRIFDCLDAVGVKADSHVKISTITNVLNLDAETCDRWFSQVSHSEVRFSLDAANMETYIKLRRVRGLDLAVQNLDHYCRTRDPNRHLAILANNINLLNLGQVPEMVQMTKKHFCHYLALVPTSATDPGIADICLNETNRELFIEAGRGARKLAEDLEVNVVFARRWPE